MMSMMMGSANYGVGVNSIMTSPQSLSMRSSQAESMTSPQAEAMSAHSPDPPSPARSDSSSSNFPPTSPPPHCRGGSKKCGVCTDTAKSMHFGGLSCDSCKAFFRRSVQNNAYKMFSCPYEKNCVIGVSSRKACQYCRFEKCLSIGMEKSWVMSEDERRKMMEQRKEKKVKVVPGSSQQRPAAAAERTTKYALSAADSDQIAQIVTLYKKAYSQVPYDEPAAPQPDASNGQSSGSFVLGPWMTFCKRIAYFFSLFSEFAELSTNDQALLLKTAITSAGIIMGSVVYDSSNGKWAAKISSKQKNVPSISSQSVEKLVPSDLISRVDTFFKKFQQICPDETMAMILILISLYSPELMGLEARDKVQYLQERYIHILQNYVKYKFKEKSSVMFPKAIVSLADIRELADRTCQMRIQSDRASSVMPNLFQGTLNLGSPHSGISSMMPMPQIKCEMNEMVPMVEKRPEIHDPIYQRILNVISQMHTSHSNTRHTSLLPIIIQILKKLAIAHQEGKNRAITNYGAVASSSRRPHRHKSKTQHRSNQRKRLIDMKREDRIERLLSQPDEVRVKEEVMDHMDDHSHHSYSMSSPPSNSSEHFNSPTISAHDFMEAFPQHEQQHPLHLRPFDQATSPPASNLDQQPISPHHSQQSGHPLQPMYMPQHCYPHSSNPHDLISSREYRSEDTMSATPSHGYPHVMSPDDGYQRRVALPPMVHSPDVVSLSPPMAHSPHIRVTEATHMTPFSQSQPHHSSARMSPTTSLTSLTPVSEPGAASLSVYQQESNFGQVLSPYSSSSSSSSPEDSETACADIFCDGLNETEVDVLMQVMERVVSIDNQDPSTSIRAVLPIQLLNELENRLCSYNDESQPPSGGISTQEYGPRHRGEMEPPSLSSLSDMEMEVDNVTNPSP